MDELKKQRKLAKTAFTRKCNIFEQTVLKDGHTDVLKGLLDEINVIFSKLESLHEQMVDISTDDSELELFEQYICELEERKTVVNNTFLSVKSTRADEKEKGDNVKLCVKKLSAPLFNGEMRLYPTFKSDFKRLMESKYGKDSYVLRQSLADVVCNEIQWVDDYDLMWDRLDENYGSSSKIVDFVLSNIKK